MKKLDALTFPLNQNALIEASAGTGKTYTISNLYLRLILGHECKPLTVAQILILTFTNAATAELKDRILARIRKAWREFVLGHSDDAFIQSLIEQIPDREQAQQRLLIASQEMDLASVFTIHGFCQRVLTEHAFESSSAWQETLSLDDSALLNRASGDYWRVRVSQLPESTLRWFLKQWSTPDALARQLRPVLFRDIGQEQPDSLKQRWQTLQQEVEQAVEAARCWWREARMSDVLREADLRANVRIAKAPFLAMMADFAEGVLSLPDLGKEGWMTLAPERIEKARKKSSAEIDTEAFQRFERLAELEIQLQQARHRYFFWDGLLFFRQHFQLQKQQNAELSPDDLLSRLYQALTGEEEHSNTSALSHVLREKYPLALVDEFQDTDDVQFAIFKHLYNQTTPSAESALIMIGDPKQAIYSFRGGDIHTYLAARQFVPESARYTLAVNWRSQPDLIAVINALFANSQTGFMHKEMPFNPVDAGKAARNLNLKNDPAAAMTVAVLPDTTDKKGNPAAHKWGKCSGAMAQHCAFQVLQYLNDMTISGANINASDICILVRDRYEAELIQNALRQRSIDSVFLRKDTVMKSPVAYSMLLVLRAIVEFKSESHIKAALLDPLFAYSHKELSEINGALSQWQMVLQRFAQAHEIWARQGVMAALESVLEQFALYPRIMKRHAEHHRTITDLRHLSEILQFQSTRIDGKAALLAWFEACVADPELLAAEGIEGTQWRLDTDQNLVQVCTIHASKGLQYPIVMLPFGSRYKDADSGFYHDEQKGLQYAYISDETLKEKQVQERLAEDIRLFYVALTRAEYHCWLGLWNNAISPQSSASGFALTAAGRVLDFATGAPVQADDIQRRLDQRLAGLSIQVESLKLSQSEELSQSEQPASWIAQQSESNQLSVQQLSSSIKQQWLLTSYSAISRARQHQQENLAVEAEQKAADEGRVSGSVTDNQAGSEKSTRLLDMRFRFTRGAAAGSYLHEVLEHCQFNDPASVADKCKEFADKYSVNKDDIPQISDWLVDVLQSSLHSESQIRLWDLTPKHRLAEMEFYLPLNDVDVSRFNRLIKKWLPQMQGHYQLAQLNGMLKGFLDLIYLLNGRFYVADYKSNFLGEAFQDYATQALEEAMLHHDYYLQALLYTVALHRYLKNKLADYDYGQHIGGAQYLFLRGMTASQPGNGVLTVSPPEGLVRDLDNLFSGEPEAVQYDH